MPEQKIIVGCNLEVGDVILTKRGKAGAVLMEYYGCSIYGYNLFMTDKGIIGEYRPNQPYWILRATAEEMEDAVNG
jgi:hypothetical protein